MWFEVLKDIDVHDVSDGSGENRFLVVKGPQVLPSQDVFYIQVCVCQCLCMSVCVSVCGHVVVV